MSRTAVVELLGKPDFSLEKGGVGIMAILNSADKWFDEAGNSIFVEYATDESSIILVTLQSKRWEDSFK
jgi:hypothetical protein